MNMKLTSTINGVAIIIGAVAGLIVSLFEYSFLADVSLGFFDTLGCC